MGMSSLLSDTTKQKHPTFWLMNIFVSKIGQPLTLKEHTWGGTDHFTRAPPPTSHVTDESLTLCLSFTTCRPLDIVVCGPQGYRDFPAKAFCLTGHGGHPIKGGCSESVTLADFKPLNIGEGPSQLSLFSC